MKILSWSRHHSLARFTTLLIALALMAGVVGCGGNVVEYDLAITSNNGGSVVSPGVGAITLSNGLAM